MNLNSILEQDEDGVVKKPKSIEVLFIGFLN